MPVSFIHPDLLTHLSMHGSVSPYPNLITAQTTTRTYDPNTNEPIDIWVDVVTMSDLAAYIEPIDIETEIRRADQTIVDNGWFISIAGFYNITVANQVTDENGNVYNVLHVDHDAFQTQTVLTCEIINTTVLP